MALPERLWRPARAVKSGMVEQRLHAIWKTPHSRTIGNRLPSERNAVPNLTIHQFHFSANTPITIRIGNKPDAEYPGGFNIFGKKFGDFEQDIVLSITYASES